MASTLDRVRRQLTDPDSSHRRIALGFLWVSSFVMVAKLAAVAKEMAIAWRFGVSETVDAYVFVLSLVNWPIGVWFSVLTVVLVPLIAHWRRDVPSAVPQFFGELLGLTLLLGITLGVLAYIGLPGLLEARWVGLPEPTHRLALAMIGPLSALLPFGLAIGLLSAWTMACGRHMNTALEALPALAILVAVLLAPGAIPEPLVWGSVAGFALQLSGLGWTLRRAGELPPPLVGFHSPVWRGFWGGVGIMSVGQALMTLTGVIDQFFAAHLDSGSISTLSYASRIMGVLLSLGALAINRSTLPVFSEVAANGDSRGISQLAMRWAKLMLLSGLLLGGLMWLTGPWVVRLLFERGAFTEIHTSQVAGVLRALLLQTPVYFASMVLVGAYAARKQYGVLLMTGVIALLIKPLSSALLVGRYGVNGIAFSTSIVYLATGSYMAFKLRTR